MAQKCFMCGREISKGILCEKCDKPRRPRPQPQPSEPVQAAPAPEPSVAPPVKTVTAAPPPSPQPSPQQPVSREAVALDPFPKAPVVPFPIESASPAITSVANVLIAGGVAAIVLGPDRAVKFFTDEAKKLFDAPSADLMQLRFVEQATGLRIGELTIPASAALRIRNRNILYSLVPLSGGAMGAVLVFREADPMTQSHASFMTFVRETVFTPLRTLRDSMLAAARTSGRDPLLQDGAATIEQILSSLEMAPEVEEAASTKLPTVSEVVREVANRFTSFSNLKNIQLQVDVPELSETFRDHQQLSETLGILMDNSLHYVPPGGQVVIGVRWMEHKGRPLLLFFVMDNGPLVPEGLRQTIFEPDFVWNPTAPDRTGRGLFRCREFALAHQGSVWVESKTGKACTFFLRVRPDGTR